LKNYKKRNQKKKRRKIISEMMAKEIALGLNLVFLALLMHNNAISCFDLVAKPKAYMMSCASGECQEAISYCVNKWMCLGVKGCQICLAYYPLCDRQCGGDLLEPIEYLSLNGLNYLPCDSSSQMQVAACAINCRSRFFTSSECSRVEGFPVCKCFNNDFSVTSSSPATSTSQTTTITTTTITTATTTQTIRPETTTESTTVASTSPWNITLTGHSDYVRCMIVLNNGDLASGSDDKTIIIWDSVTYSIKRVLNNHTNAVYSLALLPNDDLASGSLDWTIKIWDPQSGILKMTLNGHSHRVISLAVLSDGSLASSSYDGTIKIWNITTGQLKRTLIGYGWIYSLALLPNGYLASGIHGGEIQVWDTMTGDLKFNISTDGRYIQSMKVLNSGDLANAYNVISNKTYGIQIRDSVSLVLKANYTGHSDSLQSLVELPNGDFATGMITSTIKIWDRATVNVKKSLYLHTTDVLSLAILKNGLLASSSYQKIVISKI
jgi:WD40 repeat protein